MLISCVCGVYVKNERIFSFSFFPRKKNIVKMENSENWKWKFFFIFFFLAVFIDYDKHNITTQTHRMDHSGYFSFVCLFEMDAQKKARKNPHHHYKSVCVVEWWKIINFHHHHNKHGWEYFLYLHFTLFQLCGRHFWLHQKAYGWWW